jgi:hypothetical protein
MRAMRRREREREREREKAIEYHERCLPMY